MKKILIFIMLLASISISGVVYTTAKETTQIKVTEVITPKYDLAGNFSEGLAWVLDAKSKKFGYIDKTEKMVIAPKYNLADDFLGGYARVRVGDSDWGIIDKTGKVIIPMKYDNVYHFSGDLFQIYTGGKWGIINKNGKVVVEPKYSGMVSSNKSLRRVSVSSLAGCIDETGKEVIPPKYSKLGPFFEGLAQAGDTIWGYIDETGKQITPIKYYYPFHFSDKDTFSEGLAPVTVGDYSSSKSGFVNREGKEVIKPKYSQVYSFSDGLAAVKVGDGIDSKWGFVDKTGKEVIKPMYSNVCNFYEGVAPVKLDKEWYLIDKAGKVVITLNYDEVYNFIDGLALVELNRNYGLIDVTGKEIVAPKYKYIGGEHGLGRGEFIEGLATVYILDDNYVGTAYKYGFIDKKGNEVIPPKYDNVGDFSQGIARFELGYHQCGLIDKTGKEIVPAKYDSIGDDYGQINLSEGLVRVRKDGQYGFIKISIEVTSLSINKSKATLVKGKSTTLKVTAKPSDATDSSVTWKSSDTKVATVDKNGKVTAKAKGTATITATAKDGSGKKVTCKITVKNPVKVTSISLNKKSLSLTKGKTSTLVATIAPTNATTQTVTWTTSDAKIATVEKNGKVKAVKKGTVTITATAKDGSGKKTTCKVTVK